MLNQVQHDEGGKSSSVSHLELVVAAARVDLLGGAFVDHILIGLLINAAVVVHRITSATRATTATRLPTASFI